MNKVLKVVALEALKLIKESPRLTPSEISDQIEKSPQYTRNVLAVLQELGLVSTPVRGVYMITELGEHVLNEKKEI